MITDFIQGEKFEQLAHFVYSPMHLSGDDYSKLENTFDVAKLFPYCIVYAHSMYAKNLLGILKDVKTPIILVTHNGDTNITPNHIIPECVHMWFAQNVAMKHPKIQSIPIGLENSRWYRNVKKRDVMQDLYNKYYHGPLKGDEKCPGHLAYMNHNVSTNPKERQLLYDLFEHKPWVYSYRGKNSNDALQFRVYMNAICVHPFMFCPEGNGIDTHRTWEVLYMDRFPIEKRNYNNQYYTDLPIVFVDSWEEVTEDFLRKKWKEMIEGDYAYEKLTFTYWADWIKSYSEKK